MDEMYTISHVALMLKVNRLTVYRWVKSGKMGSIRIGKLYRIPESAINAYLESVK